MWLTCSSHPPAGTRCCCTRRPGTLDDLELHPLPDGVEPDDPYIAAQERFDDIIESASVGALEWARAACDMDPISVPVSEAWLRLLQIADGLGHFSELWEQWAKREVGVVGPVAHAAIATGARSSFDRQASRLYGFVTQRLASADPWV